MSTPVTLQSVLAMHGDPALCDRVAALPAGPGQPVWQDAAADAPLPVVADALQALRRLTIDEDVMLAALLGFFPALADAFIERPPADHEAVAALLEGQRTAEQVWSLHAEDSEGRNAEGLRRLLLAMLRDLRVVPILLARQLGWMHHADGLPAERRQAMAALTRDMHAPLANRLGIWQLKWELEDLAFRHLQPEVYQRIARLLDEKREAREAYIEQVRRQLGQAMHAHGVDADVAGRPKHIYSIWRKMQKKNVPIGDLYDLRAVRVLVADVQACYAALGVVHALWTPVPSEFDDYIARPKPNGYRSLHTAVIGPEGKTLEVQIRTHEMHNLAELGVAAHWRYKEGRGAPGGSAIDKRVEWMRRMLEAGTDAELAGELQAELAEDRVYALTPKGEVIDLPLGATPLDFAYRVHTMVGHRCRGAKIDGRIVPLDYRLNTGERVEILTARTAEPRRDWLVESNGFLASARSREKVRSWFNRLDRDRNLAAGRDLLEKELRRMGVAGAALEPLLARFNAASVDDLYVLVALGDVGPHQVGRAVLEDQRAQSAPPAEQRVPVSRPRPPAAAADGSQFVVEGVANLLAQPARCCQPLPGEPVAGYLTRARGITVHRADCASLLRLLHGRPERAVPVQWGQRAGAHEATLEVRALDRKGLLKDLAHLVAQDDAHVLDIQSRSSGAMVAIRLGVRVRDYGQLSRLLARMESLPAVESAVRR